LIVNTNSGCLPAGTGGGNWQSKRLIFYHDGSASRGRGQDVDEEHQLALLDVQQELERGIGRQKGLLYFAKMALPREGGGRMLMRSTSSHS
jgi:hypothetical protein